ncbi:MAG: hypothetical protein ACLQVL_27140 [Terriglobia bacterium]
MRVARSICAGRKLGKSPADKQPRFEGDAAPWANSSYNALQLKLEKDFSHGIQFLVTYTWSKSIDNASAVGGNGELGSFSSLQDPNNMELEQGLSSFEIPHVLQLTYTYDLPFGCGKALAGRVNSVNAFNHPQFQGHNATLNSGSFGVITDQANSLRQAQVVLKLYW